MRIRPWLALVLLILAPVLGAESQVAPVTPVSQPTGGDAFDAFLLSVISKIKQIKPGTSTRPDVERILSRQRGLAGFEQFYHYPGYPEIQVKVTYRLDPGKDQRKDVVDKIDPPFLIEAKPLPSPPTE